MKRRTGWTTRELDIAIRQVRPDVLDTTANLALLADLKCTKRGTASRATRKGARCSAAIDTTRWSITRPTGSRCFRSSTSSCSGIARSRTRSIPISRSTTPAPGYERTELTLNKIKATIAAAFQVSEADVALLTKAAHVSKFNLRALSDMYHRVLFARGFKLTVQEMNWLERLAGGLPAPDQIPAFVEQVEWLLGSKVSVADAWFLLRGSDATTAHLEPRDDEIAADPGRPPDRAAEDRGRASAAGPARSGRPAASQAPRRARLGRAAHRRRRRRRHGHEAVLGSADESSGRAEEADRSAPRRSRGRAR